MSLLGSNMRYGTGPGNALLLQQVLQLKMLCESGRNGAEQMTHQHRRSHLCPPYQQDIPKYCEENTHNHLTHHRRSPLSHRPHDHLPL